MQPLRIFTGFAAALCVVLAATLAHGAETKPVEHPRPRNESIVRTLQQSGNFTILVDALQKTGLERDLERRGPYTIFAPTDEAFRKLGKKRLDELMQPQNAQELANIIRYHIVRGNVASGEIKGHEEVTTIDQRMLDVNERNGVLKVEEARVVEPDVAASNGTIQVINKVLTP